MNPYSPDIFAKFVGGPRHGAFATGLKANRLIVPCGSGVINGEFRTMSAIYERDAKGDLQFVRMESKT